ncbi:MAG: hypothetical protein V9H26_04375 [Verrucomicrobiota bacterium]
MSSGNDIVLEGQYALRRQPLVSGIKGIQIGMALFNGMAQKWKCDKKWKSPPRHPRIGMVW